MQQKIAEVESERNVLKKFKKIVNASSMFQCKFCSMMFTRDELLDHTRICSEQAADRSRQSVLPPLYGGQGASTNFSRLSVMTPTQPGMSFNVPSIQVAECKLEQNKVMCHLVVTVDEEERQFTKSLEDFLLFHRRLQETFKGFDFEQNGIQLAIKFPQNQDDLAFYLSNYLPYELQRYSETVVRIPFIAKSPVFKEFFRTEKSSDANQSMAKMAVMNDSPFSEREKPFTLRDSKQAETNSARKRRGEDRYLQ